MREELHRRQVLGLLPGLLAGCAALRDLPSPPVMDVRTQVAALETFAGADAFRRANGIRGRVVATVAGGRRLDARFWLAPDTRRFELHHADGRVFRLLPDGVRVEPPGASLSAASYELHCWRELLLLPLLLREARWRMRALEPELLDGTWCQGLQLSLPLEPARAADWFELRHDGRLKVLRYQSGFGRAPADPREQQYPRWKSVGGVTVPALINLVQEDRKIGTVEVRDVLLSASA